MRRLSDSGGERHAWRAPAEEPKPRMSRNDQTLRDESAIRALTAFYSDAVTHLDAARAASIYADDGCVSIAGAELHGRQAIQQGMRQSFAAFDILQLIEHGGIVEVEGDSARARWSTVELTIKRGASQLNVIFGRYEDELARLPEGWRFKRRSFTMAGRTQIETAKTQVNPEFFKTVSASWPVPV
jgi:ketosteroid isomerase-like protein